MSLIIVLLGALFNFDMSTHRYNKIWYYKVLFNDAFIIFSGGDLHGL